MNTKPVFVPTLMLAVTAAAVCACSKGQPAATAPAAAPVATPTAAAPLQPLPPGVAGAATPASTALAQEPAAPVASGYSCTFPGPAGRSVLARFTLDGAGAHDDQGMAFTVLTNSPTALVLAHPRDDQTATPGGDIGAYVVAIDRRTLTMVQSAVGVSGRGGERRGRCIAG